MENIGYGQQQPNDAADEFNKTAFLVGQMMARMDTAKLVKVVAVHSNGEVAAGGTVDVQPLVSQIDGNNNPVPHGIVSGIPWFRLQGGVNAVVCDPAVGDIGQVVASDRDTSVARATKAVANPGSLRKFKIADGTYIGGSLNVAPNQYLVFTTEGVRLVDASGNSMAMSSDGIRLTPASGKLVEVSGASKFDGAVQMTGALEVDGAIDAKGGVKIEGGGTITRFLGGTITPAFPATVPAQSSVTATVSIPGAKVGDFAIVARPASGAPNLILGLYAFVSAADTVTLVAYNSTQSSVLSVTASSYNVLVMGSTP